jgi:hypothetical protein
MTTITKVKFNDLADKLLKNPPRQIWESHCLNSI